MSSLIAQAAALVGVSALQSNAQDNAYVQNSSVFNPALSFNSTGYKDNLSNGNGSNIALIVLFVIGIAIIFLMFK